METLSAYDRVKRTFSNSFLFEKYPLNLYLFMLTEILLSLHERGSEYLYREHKDLPKREVAHLSEHYDLSKIEKIIVVGSGAVPYTALFFSKHFQKPTYAIERNAISYYACLRLLRRLKTNQIRLVREAGQLYRDYDNSLVIITLHTRLKQEVLDQALGHRTIVVIRQPLRRNARVFEGASLHGMRCTAVVHKRPLIVSVFLSNQNLEIANHRAHE